MVHMQPGILFMVEKEKHLSVQAHRVQTPTYRYPVALVTLAATPTGQCRQMAL